MFPEVTSYYAVAFALVVIRVGAALRLLPFFGGGVMPWLPWLALSSVLALVLVPFQTGDTVPSVMGDASALTALALKELFIGIVIGTLARIAFSVLEMLGDIAHTLALPIASGATETGFRSLYPLMGTAVFFLIGGHHSLIEGLSATLTCIPVFVMPAAAWGPEPVVKLFTGAVAAATLAAIPLFAAGMVSDLLVGGISHILESAPVFGATSIRSLAILTVAALSLGGVVSVTLDLLRAALNNLSLCVGG